MTTLYFEIISASGDAIYYQSDIVYESGMYKLMCIASRVWQEVANWPVWYKKNRFTSDIAVDMDEFLFVKLKSKPIDVKSLAML